MSKALLVASIVAGVALATAATAEPFGAARSHENGVQPAPQTRAAEDQRRRDLWEARERLAEQRQRQRHRQQAGQNAGGYPGQTPYAYGPPNGGYGAGGGYSGDYGNYGDPPPPRPAPPQSPRGLHDGLWYY
jgi:hypothetical protein